MVSLLNIGLPPPAPPELRPRRGGGYNGGMTRPALFAYYVFTGPDARAGRGV